MYQALEQGWNGLQLIIIRVTVKAGMQERGTEVKCGPRAIITCTVRAGRLYSLDWTGLTQKSVFQCRTEAKHTYLFTKVACIACFRVFPLVGRGQRSRAYLMSFNEKIRRALIYHRHRTPAFC